jgi:hypothetical protein
MKDRLNQEHENKEVKPRDHNPQAVARSSLQALLLLSNELLPMPL